LAGLITRFKSSKRKKIILKKKIVKSSNDKKKTHHRHNKGQAPRTNHPINWAGVS
jgi:hypothetical protein